MTAACQLYPHDVAFCSCLLPHHVGILNSSPRRWHGLFLPSISRLQRKRRLGDHAYGRSHGDIMSKSLIGKYVIVRSSPSGCWAGTLKSVDGKTVEMTDARRLWRWWAAEGVSLSGVAAAGLHPKKLKECRIASAVTTAVVMEVCEILLATDAAKKSITSQEAVSA